REVDSDATNIDLSLTYNLTGGGGGAFATAATYATPPADWPQLAADVAQLFCEESASAIEDAVATEAARSDLAGCVIHQENDGFTRMVDVVARDGVPSPAVEWSSRGTSTYEGT